MPTWAVRVLLFTCRYTWLQHSSAFSAVVFVLLCTEAWEEVEELLLPAEQGALGHWETGGCESRNWEWFLTWKIWAGSIYFYLLFTLPLVLARHIFDICSIGLELFFFLFCSTRNIKCDFCSSSRPFLLRNFTNVSHLLKWHCDKFSSLSQLHHFPKVEKVSRSCRFKRGKWKEKKTPIFLASLQRQEKKILPSLHSWVFEAGGEKPLWTSRLGLLRLCFAFLTSCCRCARSSLWLPSALSGEAELRAGRQTEAASHHLAVGPDLACKQSAGSSRLLCIHFPCAFKHLRCSVPVRKQSSCLTSLMMAGGQELQRGSLKSSLLHLGSSTGCPSGIEVTEPAWLALCSWVASSSSRGLDAGGPAQHPTGEGPQPGWEHTCTLPRYLPLQSCLLQPFSPRNAAIWDCHCDNLFIMQIGPLPACPSVSFGCLLYLCTGDCCEEILHTQQFNNPLEYGVDSACAALQICLWIN